MIKRENLFLLGINTIIVIIAMIVLFKRQDDKIKSYIRKLDNKKTDKKNYQNINNNIEQPLIIRKPEVKNIEINQQPKTQNNIVNSSNNIVNSQNKFSDIDSFVDPLQE